MADAQKTIDLIFNGIDKTGAATLSALDNTKSFTGSVKNLTQPIADFTVGALKIEAGLLAAGAAMTIFAVKTAGDFDTAFRQISTIVNASDDDLAGFKASILDYAATSTQPIERITAALAAAIGSGVDWSQSLGLIATAEKLAVATRSDLDSTTKVLVSTLNSYGLGMEKAAGLSDLFFKIIDMGDISMADLSASFAKVAPVAKIAGVSLEDIGGAIAVLTASGIAPAEAIESLRAAITNIIAPSKEATELAATLGLNFNATGLKADGLAGLMAKVGAATGGSGEQIKTLFGSITGFTAAATLAGPQAQKFAEAVVIMGNVSGATDAAFAKMAGNMHTSAQTIVNAFTGMMIAIGSPLLDEFGGVAQAIAKIFQALGASVKEGALKDLVSYIEGLMSGLQKTLETVATNLPAALAKADLSGFKGGIDAVVGAFARLFSNIDITTVDGLTRAIELAGAAFLGLSKFTAGVIDSFKPLSDKLVEIGAQVGGLSSGFFEGLGNIGGAALQINLLAQAIGGLLPWLETLVGLMVAKQGLSLVGAISALVTTLPAMTAALSTAGVVMAAYFASDKVVALVSALVEWKKANDHLKDSQEQSTKVTAAAIPTLERFAQTSGIAVTSIDAAMKLVDSGAVVWSAAVNGWVKAGDALADVAVAAKDTASPLDQANKAMLDTFAASEKAAGGTGKLAGAQKEVHTYALKTVPIFDALTGAITGYEQQLVRSEKGTINLTKAGDKAGASLTKIAEETKKAEEAQRKWNEEVAKMKFQEKLALIEQQTKIMSAQIEANAKITVAAFDSIDTAIESTGKLVGDLFGLYVKLDKLDFSTQNKLENQIDLENKRRDEALNLQKALTEAQIDQMKAQTDALLKGDGLIKIDGAGLKPHLEAFMWEILQAIQIKVNANGLKMLLGA